MSEDESNASDGEQSAEADPSLEGQPIFNIGGDDDSTSTDSDDLISKEE